MTFLQKLFWGRKPTKSEGGLRSELLEKVEVYYAAMHYLATCGPFDADKFERLDNILAKTGVSFGSAKRQEMLAQSALMLPTKTTGGVEELRVGLQESLTQAFQTFNKMLKEVSPTVETAREVEKILNRYKL